MIVNSGSDETKIALRVRGNHGFQSRSELVRGSSQGLRESELQSGPEVVRGSSQGLRESECQVRV